jgi:hypothetical protein
MKKHRVEGKPLPLYRSHKRIGALKIRSIRFDTGDKTWIIRPEEEGYMPFMVTTEYMSKHNPRPGGYYVLYNDGYESFSPANAFEEGATRIPEVADITECPPAHDLKLLAVEVIDECSDDQLIALSQELQIIRASANPNGMVSD